MLKSRLSGRITCLAVVLLATAACAEDIFRESFEQDMGGSPLERIWGDVPETSECGIRAAAGVDGARAAVLEATFPAEVQHRLAYWAFRLPEPLPLVPELENVSFRVKTNVPLSIKIGLSPFGFIYHGPGVKPSPEWQEVQLERAYEQLRRWCEGGGRSASDGFLESIIVAVTAAPQASVTVAVDEFAVTGSPGAAAAVREERFARRIKRVRIAPISLIWDEGRRTLEATLTALDEAGLVGADLACLPQECVDQEPEPIPGPTSSQIAQKAAQYRMYVVGNLRERDGDAVCVTSFLCDREGQIVGKYRKSHRLPNEEGIALGDALPVFATDFGAIGLKIGSDHYFPEIDTVLARRGASLVVWSTRPFAQRDEHFFSGALRGRAVQNGLHYAVAQYAGKEGYGGYADRFSWTASWPLGRAQVLDRDGHTQADSGHRGGVALATLPAASLGGSPRNGGYETSGPYAAITAAELPPPPPENAGPRLIRAAAIECEPNLDRLIAKLDQCGRQECDIVCLWEYVWYHNDEQVEQFRERNQQWLARIADAARQNRMNVVIAGELERGFNEAIVYDRDGREVGRYTKLAQTTSRDSQYYCAGDRVGIFDLDFGRVCTKICLDVSRHEIDRVAALHQVDLMLLSTQDAGPYSEHIRLRDGHRCIDNGYYLLRAAGGGGECDHRTYIMDPWGVVLAASQFGVGNSPVVATIDLSNRPRFYQWPEDVRRAGAYPDPVIRGIPAEDRNKMYGRFNRPIPAGDLRAVVLACRRPELYVPQP